ncbi:hypothetical protein AB0F91_42765 [Amycolatopsis sp. NPDC023774]|uniref:hypothetical protein n=1 Tax=Amycolatopsis sp. NPDC023774 TaxID=3155015 RepID=UPI0034079F30
MRFSTNDGMFGLVVEPVSTSGQSRFQLIIEGQLVGDAYPNFAYGAFEELAHLPRFSDERLGRLVEDTGAVLELLRTEEELHDPATVSLAEAQDRWFVQRYIYQSNVVLIGREYVGSSLDESALISIVECVEYASIVEMARGFWARNDERFRSELWRVNIYS